MRHPVPERYREIWKSVLHLGAPVSGSVVTRNLMRTTDVLIAAALSPSAVAGLAVADLYRQVQGRIGGGVGGGAVALASQDTGAGAAANRDEAVTQAALLCVLVAVPFAVVAVLFGRELVALVGADPAAARQGGAYLAVTLLVSPLTLPKAVFAQAFSAVGDTRTPMAVGIAADALNVGGSLALGLGWFGAPRFGVLGLGVATAGASVLATLAYVVLLVVRSPYSFTLSQNAAVTRQLLRISLPQALEGVVTSVAVFPFARLLLGFDTAVYAGYEVAWRLYTQIIGGVGPGLTVATKILVGQAIGEEDPAAASTTVRAVLLLELVLVGAVGAGMALGAGPLVDLFVSGDDARRYAVLFTRLLGAVAVVGVANNVLSGALQGASETRIPLLSRVVGMFGGMVGVSWLLGVGLGWGIAGALVGLVACYVLMLAVSVWGYARTDWAGRAAKLLAERGSADD